MGIVDDNANAIARKSTEVISPTDYRIKTTAKIDNDDIDGMLVRDKTVINMLKSLEEQMIKTNILLGMIASADPDEIT